MKRLAITMLTLVLATPAHAQESDLMDHPRVREAVHLLDVWLDAQRAYQRIPGFSVAVVHDQDLVWAKGFGYADREQKTPATSQTVYAVCSISKLFTSVSVMQLRDQGRLRLDDFVGSHLGWFDIGDTYPDAPAITIEAILMHSSGLPAESDYPYWTPPDFPFPTREQMIDRLSEQEELYPAFEYFQYSNLGFALAGEIVAAISGQSYGDYVRANILDPLGMTSTGLLPPANERGRRWAIGYSAWPREGTRTEVPFFQPGAIAPAAGFASTVEDLAKFASWQFRVLHHESDELLARNALREMYRVHWLSPDGSLRWGLGFGTWRSNDRTYVGHSGGCPGYMSHFNLEPEGRIATIFASNANGVDAGSFTRRAQEIMGPAIRSALDTDSEEPTAAELEIYTGTYSEAPWRGESEVVLWRGSLAVISLPTGNPLGAMTELRKTGEHTFRRVRDDGALGEEFRFDIGADGLAVRMWRRSNYIPKVDP